MIFNYISTFIYEQTKTILKEIKNKLKFFEVSKFTKKHIIIKLSYLSQKLLKKH